LEKAVELTLQLAQGSEGGAQGEGEAMLLAEDEAKGDTQAETPQREVWRRSRNSGTSARVEGAGSGRVGTRLLRWRRLTVGSEGVGTWLMKASAGRTLRP
jgi:hypothetical protein